MADKADSMISHIANNLGLSAQYSTSDQHSLNKEDIAGWHDVDAALFVGDNIDSLKQLLDYEGCIVDLCYIDPPYNTGSKFIYNDTRKTQSKGVFGTHSSWMEFMLPRLVYANYLLKDTGVIAISVDDYEQAYLKILMDKIFGEDNFIGNIIVCRTKNGKGSRKNIATNHEYLLIYGKSKLSRIRGQVDTTTYNKSDEFGNYRIDGLFRKKGAASLRSDRPNMFYPIYYEPDTGKVSVDPVAGWKSVVPMDSKGVERRWIWGVDTARTREKELYASKNGVIYIKNYASDSNNIKRTKVRSIWDDPNFYTEQATKEIKKIFGSKIFDTPKPLAYIEKIIDICSDESAVILDFFAGSGTTAQAVARLNNTNNSSRRCILMESNSDVPLKHIARRHGCKKISDITTQRLKQIQKEHSLFNFRVVKS